MIRIISGLLFLLSVSLLSATDLNKPIVDDKVVFEELDGLLAVEAEFFYKQSLNEIRQWYRTSKDEVASVGRDDDPSHVAGASNGAYLEILPDTRVTHADELIGGENFSGEPGKMAVVHYNVYFNTPGKYYVWARAHSTGGEDNGIHVGLDGEWPESGQRLQWCEGKQTWRWESKQRTEEVHCGEPYKIFLEIESAGQHEIMFSLREDGFEFDKFLLTMDRDYKPGDGMGPEVKVKSGNLPEPFPVVAAVSTKPLHYMEKLAKSVDGTHIMKAIDFPFDSNDYYENGSWLAINPETHKEATTSLAFPFDEGPKYNDLWEGIEVKKGDQLSVWAKIGSADGQEFSRGRWAGIAFAPVTKGKVVLAVKKDDGEDWLVVITQ